MRPKRWRARCGPVLALLVATSAAMAWASAWAQQPPAPPVPDVAAVPAKGAAAWQQLVGNTVVAQARGGGYTEFYGSDGAVVHLDADGKAKGRWTLEGDKVCFDFPEEDDRSCVTVEVEGAKGAFVDEDNARDVFTVLPGNPKNL